MRPHRIGGFVGPQNDKIWGNFEEVIVRSLMLKWYNFGQQGLFMGLVVIPRMCLLYVNFGSGRTCTVRALLSKHLTGWSKHLYRVGQKMGPQTHDDNSVKS